MAGLIIATITSFQRWVSKEMKSVEEMNHMYANHLLELI
jgi:hypothetical protein